VAVLAAAPRILREGAIPAAQIARALAAPAPPARPAQTAAGGIEGARL